MELPPLPATTDCWYLTGPTASGKTAVAMELAGRLDAEIVSLDSMTLYRGMDIGTAKPSRELQARVPHHLLDLVEPNEEFSLAQYVELAHRTVAEIRNRGRQVLFVGGTPLYLKALLRGVHQGPPPDWEFRQRVLAEVQEVGVEPLFERLRHIDPLSAAKLHPHDLRRIIRALEVYKQTGEPISHLQVQFDEGRPAEECKVFVLSWPRRKLHERINARVDQMFAQGLIEEVRGLLAKFGGLSRTASQAVGYRETIAYLEGQRGLEETRELVKKRTRQFARRQETWFRSLSECRPVPLEAGIEARTVAERIVDAV